MSVSTGMINVWDLVQVQTWVLNDLKIREYKIGEPGQECIGLFVSRCNKGMDKGFSRINN